MAFTFPSSPSAGDQYVSPAGRMYFYADGSWSVSGSVLSPNPIATNKYKYRTIYTRGYVSGGYKSSSPWKNTNRTVHTTDTTTNLGDRLDYGGSYIKGGYSDYHQYVYGCSDSFSGSTTWTSSVNMATEAARSHSSSWDLKTARDDTAVLMNASLLAAYIVGGSNEVDKHNYVTEVMLAAGSVPARPSGSYDTYGQSCGWFGQYRGYVQSYEKNQGHYISFATETWTAITGLSATDGWGKAMSTKHGYAYVKNIGNTGTSTWKMNDITGVQISALTFPESSGEENFETGQNWGYSLGNYNGVQNNNTHKINYLTDAMTTMGSDTQPKGHDGMSSAATASASAFVLGGL